MKMIGGPAVQGRQMLEIMRPGWGEVIRGVIAVLGETPTESAWIR